MSSQTPPVPEVDIQPLLLRCLTCASKGPSVSETSLAEGHNMLMIPFQFGVAHAGHEIELEAITTAPAELAGRTVKIKITEARN